MASNELILKLQESLQRFADTKASEWWQNYVKDAAPFLGVKMAQVRKLLHTWYNEDVKNSVVSEVQVELAFALLRLSYTEEKLAGTIFLQEILLPQNYLNYQDDIPRFAAIFDEGYIYDWNICDWFCVKLLSSIIKKEGLPAAKLIADWHNARNLWRARASVVAFVYSASQLKYYPLIKTSCETLITRPERFAKTAVGWVLREINQHDHDFVTDFIERNLPNFSNESLKNTMKYFKADECKKYFSRFRK